MEVALRLRPIAPEQAQLIKKGKFTEAQNMDVKDVRSKFGSKYDEAIRQLRDYTKKLFD
jgi:filamentous hemagglutinin